MGCPDIYYLRALQYFAHCLNFNTDRQRAKELSTCTSIGKLEKEILDWKNKIDYTEFYFDAGRVFEKVITEADENDCCDGLNACLGDINSFKKLIGVKHE